MIGALKQVEAGGRRTWRERWSVQAYALRVEGKVRRDKSIGGAGVAPLWELAKAKLGKSWECRPSPLLSSRLSEFNKVEYECKHYEHIAYAKNWGPSALP